MKMLARLVALMITALFIGSTMTHFVGPTEQDIEPISLDDEPVIMEATSPGHPVLAEYVGAHWCGPCHSMSANLHSVYGTNGGGGSQSEDFTYISFLGVFHHWMGC